MVPSDVFRQRMREVRETKRMRQQDLADALSITTTPIDRATIGKMESTDGKRRGIQLDEALNIAAALEVSPLHMFTPLTDGARVEVGDQKATARRIRAWIRGEEPLRGMNSALFFTEVPASEYRPLARQQIEFVKAHAQRRKESRRGEH